MSPVSIVMVLSVVGLLVFGYMRNKQAARNDKRRDRFWDAQKKLIEILQSQKRPTGKDELL